MSMKGVTRKLKNCTCGGRAVFRTGPTAGDTTMLHTIACLHCGKEIHMTESTWSPCYEESVDDFFAKWNRMADGEEMDEMSVVRKADGPNPGVDAPKEQDEVHILLAQLQEALQTASTAASAIVGLIESRERTYADAAAKLDKLRGFLRSEDQHET